MHPDLPRSFRTTYWGDDQSTVVQFEPITTMPPNDQISACMVFAVSDDHVVLSSPRRGWGLLGGHREAGETAEQCIRREAMEEAAIELGELRLVGRWVTRKLFESEHNQKYTDPGYQLLYVADVTKVNEFYPALEVSDRAFVALHQVPKLHHNYTDFQEVFEFFLETRETTSLPDPEEHGNVLSPGH